MSVLEGNPAILAQRTHDYLAAADEIARVASELRSLGQDYDGLSEALETLREQTATVSSQLDQAHARYRGTSVALKEYAVALGEAQRKADHAAADLEHGDRLLAGAEEDLACAQSHQRALDESGSVNPASVDAADEDVREATRRMLAAQEVVHAANAAIEQARRDRDAAAELAISRIHAAIEGSNDSLLDRLGALVEALGDFLSAVGRWIQEFLADVVDFLQRLVATVIAILVIVALVAVVLLVAAAMIAAGGVLAILGTLIAAGLMILLAVVIARIASDVLAPDPTVAPHFPDDEDTTHVSDLDNVLDDTAEVDQLGDTDGDGVDDASVVKVVKVVDEDGTVRWRVILPSTQEWLTMLGDKGAVNDLDSNLALMLTPALQTQYERAVLEAMRQAGVGPDDPVMLVGFSQGGIMAGHLAAYNNDFNWSAVVVSGAPVDGMPIPDHVHVVSVQHRGDVVPGLDFMTLDGEPKHNEHWVTIQADGPGSSPLDKHNADAYSDTFGAHLDEVPPGWRLEDFFAGGSHGHTESYYAWAE